MLRETTWTSIYCTSWSQNVAPGTSSNVKKEFSQQEEVGNSPHEKKWDHIIFSCMTVAVQNLSYFMCIYITSAF